MTPFELLSQKTGQATLDLASQFANWLTEFKRTEGMNLPRRTMAWIVSLLCQPGLGLPWEDTRTDRLLKEAIIVNEFSRYFRTVGGDETRQSVGNFIRAFLTFYSRLRRRVTEYTLPNIYDGVLSDLAADWRDYRSIRDATLAARRLREMAGDWQANPLFRRVEEPTETYSDLPMRPFVAVCQFLRQPGERTKNEFFAWLEGFRELHRIKRSEIALWPITYVFGFLALHGFPVPWVDFRMNGLLSEFFAAHRALLQARVDVPSSESALDLIRALCVFIPSDIRFREAAAQIGLLTRRVPENRAVFLGFFNGFTPDVLNADLDYGTIRTYQPLDLEGVGRMIVEGFADGIRDYGSLFQEYKVSTESEASTVSILMDLPAGPLLALAYRLKIPPEQARVYFLDWLRQFESRLQNTQYKFNPGLFLYIVSSLVLEGFPAPWDNEHFNYSILATYIEVKRYTEGSLPDLQIAASAPYREALFFLKGFASYYVNRLDVKKGPGEYPKNLSIASRVVTEEYFFDAFRSWEKRLEKPLFMQPITPEQPKTPKKKDRNIEITPLDESLITPRKARRKKP